jgi:hypothetical protein
MSAFVDAFTGCLTAELNSGTNSPDAHIGCTSLQHSCVHYRLASVEVGKLWAAALIT